MQRRCLRCGVLCWAALSPSMILNMYGLLSINKRITGYTTLDVYSIYHTQHLHCHCRCLDDAQFLFRPPSTNCCAWVIVALVRASCKAMSLNGLLIEVLYIPSRIIDKRSSVSACSLNLSVKSSWKADCVHNKSENSKTAFIFAARSATVVLVQNLKLGNVPNLSEFLCCWRLRFTLKNRLVCLTMYIAPNYILLLRFITALNPFQCFQWPMCILLLPSRSGVSDYRRHFVSSFVCCCNITAGTIPDSIVRRRQETKINNT